MTIQEAAKMLEYSPCYLRHLCTTGRVRARVVLVGARGHYEVDADSILEYERTKSRAGFPKGGKRNGPRGERILPKKSKRSNKLGK